jgi:hypothetical protein
MLYLVSPSLKPTDFDPWSYQNAYHLPAPFLSLEKRNAPLGSDGQTYNCRLETQRYLKYMPEQIELAANVSTKLAQLAKANPTPTKTPHHVACPQCGHSFSTKKTSHLHAHTKRLT